jgi:hypothetical protein
VFITIGIGILLIVRFYDRRRWRRWFDALEADIEQWTPAEDLALGRRCSVQSDGVEVAGVPIGTAAYVHSVARGWHPGCA